MSLLSELQAIRDEHGALTPVLVVETARDPGHPLHSRFDWDDSVAAEKWRLEQASQLLRVTKRVDLSRPTDLRAFTAIKGENSHKADYVPTEEALADDFTRAIVLRDMKREWQLFKRRYEHMAEFADLIQAHLQEKAS